MKKKPRLRSAKQAAILGNAAKPAYTFLSSIEDLPLKGFMRCVCKDDYTAIYTGNPPVNEIADAWMTLLSQYYQAKDDDTMMQNTDLTKEMLQLQVRKAKYGAIMEWLRTWYDKEYIQLLIDDGHDYEYAPETYLQDLTCVENMERNNWNELARIEKEYVTMKENSQGDKPTEEHFYEFIAAMNELWHTSHSVDRVNTMEYAIMAKRYNKEIEKRNFSAIDYGR